jgi:hypothetical protein
MDSSSEKVLIGWRQQSWVGHFTLAFHYVAFPRTKFLGDIDVNKLWIEGIGGSSTCEIFI